jgi:ParB-like chromosome segregation protein Spo0J
MQRNVKIDIGKMIRQELDKQERSVNWLAGKIDCHRTTLLRMLKKTSINSEILYKISVALKVDYHALYSLKTQKKFDAKTQQNDAIMQQ